jgi:hypothetical protein
MVPEFCRGCGDKLGAMDRVYCGKPGCQERGRVALYAQLGSLPKERMLAMLAGDARAYAQKSDPGGFELTKKLEAKVKAHPWDDCAAFLKEREEIAQGRPVDRKLLGEGKGGKGEPYDQTIKSRQPASEVTGDLFAGLERNLDKLKQSTNKQIEHERSFGEAAEKLLERAAERRMQDKPSGCKPLPLTRNGHSFPMNGPSFQAARPSSPVALRFGPTRVPAGSKHIFQAIPQLPFRGKHLVVGSGFGSSFNITSLRIGVSEQLTSGADGVPTPIPASVFEEGVVGVHCNLGLDVAYVGQLVGLVVENKSQMEQIFEATLVGEAAVL